MAGLVASHLVLLMAGTAWAQSAEDQKTVEQDTRLGQPNATAVDEEDADPADLARLAGIDDPQAALDQEALQELRRQNLRETTVDGLSNRPDLNRNDAQGISVGTFTLRPSITETLGTERTTTDGKTKTRSYVRSAARASLTSNWSEHELRINGEGTWDKTFSGKRSDNPEGKLDATLRLDLWDETTATLRAGYSLEREDVTDPNAVANATAQSDVNEWTAGAELTRSLGVLRATVGLDLTRNTYSPVKLASGALQSQEDRNQNSGTLRGRIGYELSPALIPFLEASYGRTLYDNHKDKAGFVRDARTYALKSGVELDMGEKLKGELALGYTIADFDDAALKSIEGWTVDGNLVWSPQRGTDITGTLKTEIEPSTTAGASGDIAYSATAILSQVILNDLSGQISTGLTLRDYGDGKTRDQKVYSLGTGLTWGLSRSLDLNADVTWEKTRQPGVANLDILRAGVGITLKR